jgi:hypothetical protein
VIVLLRRKYLTFIKNKIMFVTTIGTFVQRNLSMFDHAVRIKILH